MAVIICLVWIFHLFFHLFSSADRWPGWWQRECGGEETWFVDFMISFRQRLQFNLFGSNFLDCSTSFIRHTCDSVNKVNSSEFMQTECVIRFISSHIQIICQLPNFHRFSDIFFGESVCMIFCRCINVWSFLTIFEKKNARKNSVIRRRFDGRKNYVVGLSSMEINLNEWVNMSQFRRIPRRISKCEDNFFSCSYQKLHSSSVKGKCEYKSNNGYLSSSWELISSI